MTHQETEQARRAAAQAQRAAEEHVAQSPALRQAAESRLAELEARVATYAAQLAQVAQTHPVCQRLMTIPGLGDLTATALMAAVSDPPSSKMAVTLRLGWG